MFRVEDECLLEAAAGPREFFARVVRVTDANVQLYRIRVECEPLAKYVQRLVVLAFVVQLMRSLIILLGTQKRGSHGGLLPPTDRVAVLYNRIADLFKTKIERTGKREGRIFPDLNGRTAIHINERISQQAFPEWQFCH